MIYLLNLNSNSSYPLEVNRWAYENSERIIHVFSFSIRCVSVGRTYQDFQPISAESSPETEHLPVFRRITGGGAVFHSPDSDISFAFSFEHDLISIKKIFLNIAKKISTFLETELNLNNLRIFDNGDILLNDIKICGISCVRKGKFFLFEGCFLIPNKTKKIPFNFSKLCFNSYGKKIRNFKDLSAKLFNFLKENFQ